MEINLEQLKKNFIVIRDIRNKVTNLFQILGDHLIKLKQTYSEFVKMNKDNLFVFGLDSFQFQSKLIDIEFGDMKRLFLVINNRMYCEYYKLYKIIAEYIKENINDRKSLDIVKLVNSFPVYKDLEPFKQYNFETIQEVHDNIILLLYGINEFILNKDNELKCHLKKQSIGLNINNFVNTFNYNIVIVKEKGSLFISYIDFFHSLHTKHLQRFAMKMNLMYTQLTNDIKFDENIESSDDQKKDLINRYQDDNINKDLLKQIKISLDDNESNSSHDSSEISYSNSPIVSKSFDFEMGNTPEVNTNFNFFNSSKQEIDLNPVKKSMGSILKKNVKKVVNSLGLFKKTKKTDEKLALSSENLINQNIINKDEMKIDIHNEDIFDKISNKSDNSINSMNSYNNDNSINSINSYNNENSNNLEINLNPDKIEKPKSLDEIFLELSTQCDNLIKSNEKNSIIVENEETITSFIEIYDNTNKKSIDSESEVLIDDAIKTDIIDEEVLDEEVLVEEVLVEEVLNEEVLNEEVLVEEVLVEEVLNEQGLASQVLNEEVLEIDVISDLDLEHDGTPEVNNETKDHIKENIVTVIDNDKSINQPLEDTINKKKKKKSKPKKK